MQYLKNLKMCRRKM